MKDVRVGQIRVVWPETKDDRAQVEHLENYVTLVLAYKHVQWAEEERRRDNIDLDKVLFKAALLAWASIEPFTFSSVEYKNLSTQWNFLLSLVDNDSTYAQIVRVYTAQSSTASDPIKDLDFSLKSVVRGTVVDPPSLDSYQEESVLDGFARRFEISVNNATRIRALTLTQSLPDRLDITKIWETLVHRLGHNAQHKNLEQLAVVLWPILENAYEIQRIPWQKSSQLLIKNNLGNVYPI